MKRATRPAPAVVRFPEPGPMPRAWFTRLVNAVEAGDGARECEARRELRRLGITVRFERPWRRTGGRPA